MIEYAILGFALSEAMALFALLVAFVILFGLTICFQRKLDSLIAIVHVIQKRFNSFCTTHGLVGYADVLHAFAPPPAPVEVCADRRIIPLAALVGRGATSALSQLVVHLVPWGITCPSSHSCRQAGALGLSIELTSFCCDIVLRLPMLASTPDTCLETTQSISCDECLVPNLFTPCSPSHLGGSSDALRGATSPNLRSCGVACLGGEVSPQRTRGQPVPRHCSGADPPRSYRLLLKLHLVRISGCARIGRGSRIGWLAHRIGSSPDHTWFGSETTSCMKLSKALAQVLPPSLLREWGVPHHLLGIQVFGALRLVGHLPLSSEARSRY